MSELKKFNVLEHKYGNNENYKYDVLPYFRNEWVSKYNKKRKEDIKNKNDFKNWVINIARYQFWARCEYEFLMAPWPFGSYKMYEKLKEVMSDNFNLDDIKKDVDFCNAITIDMRKIDVYQQIMMNIDIVVDILYNEFKIDALIEKNKSRK